MIKLFLKQAFERLGYRITRSIPSSPSERPFDEQRRLVQTERPIIFDVGAHYGETSLQYRNLFPSATIYAFEPFPASYEKLKHNTSADPMIKIFNFGFSDVEEPRLFFSNASSATNSLFETDDRGAETWGNGLLETSQQLTLPFSTIDRFVAKAGIPSIDILKLDVQGAEYLVLKGAEQYIAASQIGLIYSEIIIEPTYKNQMELHEVLRIFTSYQFRLHNFYNFSHTSNSRLRQLDAIFTRRANESATC